MFAIQANSVRIGYATTRFFFARSDGGRPAGGVGNPTAVV